jgi:hypothetical protein
VVFSKKELGVPDHSGVAESPRDDADGSDLDACVALAAFNGAVIGLVGCLAAAVAEDTMLSLIAGFGAAICAWLWKLHLTEGGVAG